MCMMVYSRTEHMEMGINLICFSFSFNKYFRDLVMVNGCYSVHFVMLKKAWSYEMILSRHLCGLISSKRHSIRFQSKHSLSLNEPLCFAAYVSKIITLKWICLKWMEINFLSILESNRNWTNWVHCMRVTCFGHHWMIAAKRRNS